MLEGYGVDTVFGIPGVHTVELYRGLPATRIRHVTPRHEQGAGFMADGYARVSGKPGVCFIITGPGMTNILTAMGQAYGDSIPMLVISSVNRTEQLAMGQGRLHELRSQQAVVAGVAAFSHTVLHPSQLPEVLARAFALFASARPRPVHIEIPIDVITAPGDGLRAGAPAAARAGRRRIRRPSRARRPCCRAARRAADGARRRRGRAAAAEARALAERLDAPVINTINAKGILPPGHPLHAGENMAWPPLREALREADVVLAVGTEFGETEMYPDPEPLRVRRQPDPGRHRPRAAGPRLRRRRCRSLGDSRLALQALLAATAEAARPARTAPRARRRCATPCGRSWWPAVAHARAPSGRGAERRCPTRSSSATRPSRSMPATSSSGRRRPRSWFNSSTGYGTLGYALPAAIGAKLAAPERPVVALVGDGGLQFTLPELASAIEARRPVIVLVWNNRAYGEIRTYMVEHGIAPIGVDLYTPDLVAIARGYGCFADRARDHAASGRAARRSSRPAAGPA